jgi:hypothetical protein
MRRSAAVSAADALPAAYGGPPKPDEYENNAEEAWTLATKPRQME